MAKVSVIVPVYNVEEYIQKCLETLVNQTLQEIEIIIVNDGSTDKSIEIAKKFQKSTNKIIIVDKENGGLSDARNYGLKYANGEYIAFLDSDDYAELDTYEKMYNIAKQRNADFVECDFIWEYPNKSKIDTGYVYTNKKEMMAYARVVAWNKLIKRELICNIEEPFPKGLRYEDIEFFYKILPKIKKFEFLKEPKIHYIQRCSSIANTQNKKNRDIFKVLNNVLNYYKQNNLFEEYKTEIEYNYARILLCSSFFRIVKINDKQLRKEIINENWKILNETFPNWKNNYLLKTDKSTKNIYLRTVNKITYKIYEKIFRIIK